MTGPIRRSSPSAWVEELAEALAPEPETSPVPIRLTYPQSLLGKLDMEGTSLEEVAADLSAGCVVSRIDRGSGEFFRLVGGRFSVNVNPSRARESGVSTAFVTSVKPEVKVSRRTGLLTCSVTFHPAFDEVSCDMGVVDRVAQERLAAEQKRRGARHVARSLLAGLPVIDDELTHSVLHGEARKRYATLQNLFALLEQRSLVAGGAVAAGVVAQEPAPGPPALRVLLRPDSVTGRFPGSGTVELRVAGADRARPIRLDLRHVLQEDIVTEPPQADIEPGTEVEVEYRPRFALQKHQRALRDFLGAKVEGDWVSLARLLIQPDALPALPGRPAPRSYFNPELNAEQRTAVTGAVTTPHAFLIQGPPGTGKTTVICEIIRQLASRGERVLLLAPMHVAVDEVLRRVGDVHGITALRLSWDDQRVAPELRGFTPDNVAGEFGRKVRQPDRSRVGVWQVQIAEREAAQQALADYQAARHDARTATEAVRIAQHSEQRTTLAAQSAEQLAGQADAAVARLDAGRSAATRSALAEQAAADGAAGQEAAAAQRWETARHAAEQAAADAVAAARRAQAVAAAWRAAEQQAEYDIVHEGEARQRLVEGQQTAQAALTLAANTVQTTRIKVTDAVADLDPATRQAGQAKRDLAAAESRRTLWGSVTAVFGRGELGEARAALDLAIGHQRGAEARLAVSRRDAGAAVAAQVRAQEQARVTQRQNESDLQRAVQAAADAHAAEPRRAGMRKDADAAARQASQARAHADSLTDPAARASAVLQSAQRDHAEAAAGAATAARHAEGIAQALTAAQAELASARVAAARAAADHVAAVQHVAAALGTAGELRESAGLAAMRAAGVLSVEPDELPEDEGVFQAKAQALAAEAARLRRYIQLEGTWFELMTAAAAKGTDLRKLGDMLVGTANLVCCTTTGFGAKVVEDADFDTLIVDEASRVVDSEFLIGAVKARRWILVGDEHQLPPYVDPVDEHHLHALAALHMTEAVPAGERSEFAAVTLLKAVESLGELWVEDEELHQFRSESVLTTAEQLRDSGLWMGTYAPAFGKAYKEMRGDHASAEREMLRAMRDHMVRSLFERCILTSPQRLKQRLVEQRRMIAPMAEIVRLPVYQGDYRSPSERELERFGVTPLIGRTWRQPVIFCDTSLQPEPYDSREGTGFVNRLEAKWVAELCRQWELDLRAQKADQLTVSILTFYRAQARIIREQLGYPGYRGFRILKFQVVDAIDRIQGQESDLVILSFCRTHRGAGRGKLNPNFGLWLQDLRRLNVACTRARRGLALVGHAPTLRALNGPDPAKEFYRHLFEMFDEHQPGTLMTHEFIAARRSGRQR
jgi:AAA domain